MASENVEAVGRLYEGWERGDFSVGAALFYEDATLVLDPELPDAGEHPGLDGFRRYMEGFLEAWESLTITPESLKEAGDRVLARVTQVGTGKDSGIPVELRYFQLWTFRDGKVIRLEAIRDEERALAELGS